MKYFLQSFSPLHWFQKGSYQFLVKECAQYWLTIRGLSLPSKSVVREIDCAEHDPKGLTGLQDLNTNKHSVTSDLGLQCFC